MIQGSTGSGKSTQVPQFILKDHAAAGKHCNIICTQPRRIAAKSVAQFVADTHGWTLGSLVGYQIGMDKNVTEATRLTFVTTGVLLEKLVNQRNMNQYTHIILDEVGGYGLRMGQVVFRGCEGAWSFYKRVWSFHCGCGFRGGVPPPPKGSRERQGHRFLFAGSEETAAHQLSSREGGADVGHH